MKYSPQIESATTVARLHFGKYDAALLADVRSPGAVRYKYVLAVTEEASGRPCLYVASEENRLSGSLGGGSHFLCVFPGSRHENLGDSNDWADLDKFKARAVEIVRERLGLS